MSCTTRFHHVTVEQPLKGNAGERGENNGKPTHPAPNRAINYKNRQARHPGRHRKKFGTESPPEDVLDHQHNQFNVQNCDGERIAFHVLYSIFQQFQLTGMCMKRTSIFLVGYGLFLILMGLAGFLSNPEKAKTALLSGGLFGTLSIGVGLLAWRGWMRARVVGLGLAAFLGVVFLWRASVSWMAVMEGQPEKAVAASLISAMLIASVALLTVLLRLGTGSAVGAD